VCLGEYGTIVQIVDVGRAVVRFGDDSERQVSLAVLVAGGTPIEIGDRVMVSIGMALEIEPQSQRLSGPETPREVTA
jgi:hydrogenase maturation factor